IVSEERGEVSTVIGREIRVWESPEDLAARIKDRLGLAETPGPSLKGFLKGGFIENWGVKIGALILVTLIWLILAGAQNLNMTINAPIDFTDPPSGAVLSEDTMTQVRLEISGPRRQVVNLKGYKVKVRVDLRGLSFGPHLIRLSAQNVELPLGLTIDRVWPQNIKVTLKPAKTRTPAPLAR
ncbi:MAG: CdaR family protein, partial [Thermodesulfobacteriota bacterium]|nr:CdaR family protein [Thermodesulfobacteriota bacterium]